MQSDSPKHKMSLESPTKSEALPFLFQDLDLHSVLSKSRYTLVLSDSKLLKNKCVLKVFPHNTERSIRGYLNESRLLDYKHPNIIQFHAITDHLKFKFESKDQESAGILMEYAPYGDFFEIGDLKEEKLVRTYFRQLIEGIEFLHSEGIAHLDLKLENLFLGEDLRLKIADFDNSNFKGEEVKSRGSKNFRAPEMLSEAVQDATKCDIYSAGIIMFALYTGRLPFEESAYENEPLNTWIKTKDSRFWKLHELDIEKTFSEGFKKLFFAMIAKDPRQRPTIEEIKRSQWYNEDGYSDEEICDFFAD